MTTKLQILRWERDLSMQQLGELTGVSAMTICRAENLKRRIGKKGRYYLSKFFEVPEEDIFTDDGYAVEA